MFVAVTEDNERVYAEDAVKTDENGNKIKYYCPECGGELILRQGTKNIWHYSHKEGNVICHFRKGGGESYTHEVMKYKIKQIVEKYNKCSVSELEWKIGNRIADYYCEIKKGVRIRKIAFECVHKHTDIDTFREKTEEYYDKGVYVIWLFNLDKFLSSPHVFKREVRINEMIREAHTMYFGRCYAIDVSNEVVYGIHLDPIFREGHYLSSTKKLSPVLLFEFIIDSFQKVVSDKWLPYNRSPAGTFTEKWW
jgi:competence CoiA-like predicted nuclease